MNSGCDPIRILGPPHARRLWALEVTGSPRVRQTGRFEWAIPSVMAAQDPADTCVRERGRRGEAGQGEAGQGEGGGGALAKYVLCRFSTALQNMKRQMYLQPHCGCAARRTTDGRDHFPPTHPPRQTTTSCIQHWARPMTVRRAAAARARVILDRMWPPLDTAAHVESRCRCGYRTKATRADDVPLWCVDSLCVRGCVVRCDVCGALSKKLI